MLRVLREYWLAALCFSIALGFTIIAVANAQAPTPDGAALPDLSGVVTVGGDGKVTVNVGLFGSQIIAWVVTTFGSVFALALSTWVWRLAQALKIGADEKLRKRFQDIILSGISIGAAKAEAQLTHDAPKIEVKNAATAIAVQYVQDHAADTAKKLGLDVMSTEAVDAVKANIEKMVNDPLVATPASISPPKAATATVVLTDDTKQKGVS